MYCVPVTVLHNGETKYIHPCISRAYAPVGKMTKSVKYGACQVMMTRKRCREVGQGLEMEECQRLSLQRGWSTDLKEVGR